MRKHMGNEYDKTFHFREICPKCKESRDFITPRNGIGFTMFTCLLGQLLGSVLYHGANFLHSLREIRCEVCGTSADFIQPKQQVCSESVKEAPASCAVAIPQTEQDKQIKCPVHKIPMVKRRGPYGEFYGCRRYPSCRRTEKIIRN